MPTLALDNLKNVEQLREKGEFEKAFDIINNLENKGGFSKEELVSLLILKSSLLLELRRLKEAQELAEKILEQSEKLNWYDKIIDALDIIAWVYRRFGKLEEALETINRAEELIRTKFPDPDKEIQKKQASLYLVKGSIFFARGNLNAIKECLEEGLNLAKIVEDKKLLMHFTLNSGSYYGIKGKLDLSLDYQKQGLALAKEINDSQNIIIALNNIGCVYREQGKLEKALENITQSYLLAKKIKSPSISVVLDSIFHVVLDKGDLKEAEKYLEEMNELKNQEEYEIIKLNYLINKALLLKANPRASNLSKAEKILKEALEEEIVLYEAHIDALLNLCDILLTDLQNTNDPEILNELQPYISRLLDLAEKNNSFSLIAETKLLEARLALLSFDIKNARKFLSKAQEIADKYGLHRLSIKISNEHDELIKEIDMWDNLKKSNLPMSERLKKTGLKEEMKRMIQKRKIEIPVPFEEDPLLLLIVTEGGVPAFSHAFSKDWHFSDELFSGFLSSFDSISKEVFSEGLDRAKFGEYTIIISSFGKFLICYLFKGQSYYAKQKLGYFTDHVKTTPSVEQILNHFLKDFHTIQLEEYPILKELIIESFFRTDHWLIKV
ncbi:MAG: tetratricopeptide repeat protein [Candidatus Lokiarchaeia archaeon]|nr:tetratricopeptide repeat protein [Candidatus Lokiarchaeia archaeon]